MFLVGMVRTWLPSMDITSRLPVADSRAHRKDRGSSLHLLLTEWNMTMGSKYPENPKSVPRLFDLGPEGGSEELSRPPAPPPGRPASRDISRGSGWPDLPAPITPEPDPQAPYPEDWLPPDLEEVLRATQRLAQCPAATAGAALLGALALLAQDDYRLETLAPDPSPPSLYLLAMSESGSHKTTAFKLLERGHQEADALLKARWDAAREERRRYQAAGEGDRAGDSEPNPRRPRPCTPVAILQDFTADGLLQLLQGGRQSIAMWTAEAGTQVNHSLGRHQAPRTLSYLNAAWESGVLSKVRASSDAGQVHISADSYSVSIVWAGQPDILTPVLFDPLALNGWLARCLICRDDAYPDPGGPRARDKDRIKAFNDTVTWHRERQDREMEYAPRPGEPPGERTLIALSEGARGLLDEFYARQRSLAARLREDGRRHESTWAERAAENGARVAALFTSWEAYLTVGSVGETLYTGEDTMSRAIRLVEWYQGEVARLAGESGVTAKAGHASHLAQVIARVVSDPASREGRHPLVTDHGVAVNTIANRLGHQEIRGDTDLRRAVIALLVEYGYIKPGEGKGRYDVHPRIGEVV